ncbi:MAG: HAD family hydrolase [Janthinobacterium lividum]
MKKALIFDLDDTVYPIKSVADEMYAELFALIRQHTSEEVYQNACEDLLTTPFEKVADRYEFDKDLKHNGLKMCLDMDYHGVMKPFDDYLLTQPLQIDKFLVTGGYTKLQKSKIKQLGIEKDFKEIFIPDPAKSNLSKTDVFKQIMDKYHYEPKDVLVIGDNPETEIDAAKELGIETFLYDYQELYSPALADYYATNYDTLIKLLQ